MKVKYDKTSPEAIYQEAQAELREASRLYGHIYDTRRHLYRYRDAIDPVTRKRYQNEIARLIKARQPHYRRYKRLMSKIVWNRVLDRYVFREKR